MRKKSKANSKKHKRDRISIGDAILKFVLLGLFVLGFVYVNGSYENTITLLAVNEDKDGNVRGGSTVDLKLKTKPEFLISLPKRLKGLWRWCKSLMNSIR